MSIEVVEAEWNSPRHVRALCTTRKGGVSSGPYESLNLSVNVGDDQADLARNREILRQSLNLPGEPCWLEQTHSINVVSLDRDRNRKADAAITCQPDTVAVVMIADCLPILLCNRAGTEVAAVHAGWRGLVNGVVQATVKQMDSPASQLLAWIGPAISQPAFEVGAEVQNKFLARYDRSEEHFVASSRAGHWLCDLPGLAAGMLAELGITEICCSKYCSYTDDSLFFSYRRKHPAGRMASLIWIESSA